MNRLAVLVLCGLATVAALYVTIWPIIGDQAIDDINGFSRKTDWIAEEAFPPALTQKVFPIGLAANIASRQIQMDKDDRYQEYIFDTFSNGDKGTLFFNDRSELAEITMDYAASNTRVWYKLGSDSKTILQKRTTDLASGALIEEGERGDDNRFVLKTYFAGTTKVNRIRTYEARGMILSGGLGGVNLIARDESFYPGQGANEQVEYLFVASDVLHTQRWDYAKDGTPTAYLKVDYRARNGWFFYPDGATKRMEFERKSIYRNDVGYWEVHTNYYDQGGVLTANRVFTRSSMIVTLDLAGIGKVRQTWNMVLPYKAEPLRLLKDNFALSYVELDSYLGQKDVRFVYKDGELSEFWYQTEMNSEPVQVRLTLNAASGAVISMIALNQKTQKQLTDVESTQLAALPTTVIKAPTGLNQMLEYEPPPAVPFEPDYPQGEH